MLCCSAAGAPLSDVQRPCCTSQHPWQRAPSHPHPPRSPHYIEVSGGCSVPQAVQSLPPLSPLLPWVCCDAPDHTQHLCLPSSPKKPGWSLAAVASRQLVSSGTCSASVLPQAIAHSPQDCTAEPSLSFWQLYILLPHCHCSLVQHPSPTSLPGAPLPCWAQALPPSCRPSTAPFLSSAQSMLHSPQEGSFGQCLGLCLPECLGLSLGPSGG